MLLTGSILPFPCKLKILPPIPLTEQLDIKEEDGNVVVADADAPAAECDDAAEGDCGLFWDAQMMDCCRAV